MQNPKLVTEVEKGYQYEAPEYLVTNGGIVSSATPQTIKFCRGNKADETQPRQEGFFIETLIEICRLRLIAVNVGDLATKENDNAILNLEEALKSLDKRGGDRKARGVEATYQK